ncbi:MAG: phosphotransferase [Candidatus Paceibacterota bacterium]|jgi:Ser/Thr protein kinase RdoA (MazF antagonist)
MKKESRILSEFPLPNGAEAERFGCGLIHETYLVRVGKEKFILQKMNPIFSTDILADIRDVSEFLSEMGRTTQKLVPTKSGKLFAKQNGEVWRLLTFVPGRIFESAEDADMAYEAGKILGQFHRDIMCFRHTFAKGRSGKTPSERYAKFLRVTGGKQTAEIEALKKEISRLPEYMFPKKTRLTVGHGDPKISNIVWNGRGTKKAIALIDIDECTNRGNTLLELGDAFRSWCGTCEHSADNIFDTEKFEAAKEGYREGGKELLTPEEIALLPRAMKFKCLELASRFLVDYFEDCYFGWDEKRYKTRREHNLARAKGQVALYTSITSKK